MLQFYFPFTARTTAIFGMYYAISYETIKELNISEAFKYIQSLIFKNPFKTIP